MALLTGFGDRCYGERLPAQHMEWIDPLISGARVRHHAPSQ
jgi:hypothetical protein